MKTLSSPLLLFVLALSLIAIGITSVYSASASVSTLVKQIVYAAIGLVLMLTAYSFDYHLLKKHSFKIMISALILCVLVRVPGIGRQINGARRWIGVGPISFQVSEYAKLALIIYMAKMLSDRRQYIKSFFSGVLPAMIITGIFAAVVVIEPDFGAAFVLSLTIFGMWLAAEMRWFHLLGLVGWGLPAGVLAFQMEPYRVRRVLAFTQLLFSPDKVDKTLIQGTLFQLYQSLTAVGSGGLWGLGLGESHQKYHYLTEAQSDFIFAIMCEEYGFFRIAGIVLLYAALILLGWTVAWRTTDLFGSLLASGITLMIFISAGVNMCVVTGLLPTKGLVMPFFSAGGSSLLICMTAIGILMSVARSQYVHQNHNWAGE